MKASRRRLFAAAAGLVRIDATSARVVAALPVASVDHFSSVGQGRAYGLELLLRHAVTEHFYGWLAYTLSRSEIQEFPDYPLHLSQWDQTHILTVLGSYKLGRGWQIGGRFRYVTGSPYTPELGGTVDYDAGTYAPVTSLAQNSTWSSKLE